LHILRRAAIFLLPLLCLAGILYFADKWVYNQKKISDAPKQAVVVKTQKKDVEYKLRTVQGADQNNSLIVNKNKNDSFFTVVLDPTHGGDDVGNIGYKSAVESNLNLQFAFKLARALRMRGLKVYLTRMEDVNTPLDTRFIETEKRNPNLFLSINCSYSDVRSLKGMEMYGFTPAEKTGYSTKTQSAMVVENRVSLAIKEDLDLPYKSALERKFFDFLALSPSIPALGLFIGYISNSEDVEQLEDTKYVDGLTERIAASIEKGLQKTLK
jgi:N-acetylmuramoyl-L-alanine amidase